MARKTVLDLCIYTLLLRSKPLPDGAFASGLANSEYVCGKQGLGSEITTSLEKAAAGYPAKSALFGLIPGMVILRSILLTEWRVKQDCLDVSSHSKTRYVLMMRRSTKNGSARSESTNRSPIPIVRD